ncbi:MAG: hypothetical protein WCJ97_12330, partial [Phycisphaerae bacterium]
KPLGEGLRTNLTEDKDGVGGPRFIYLRDSESGQYWSLTGAPDYPQMTEWECRIGLGYQINHSVQNGIAAAWRVFVPQIDLTGEYWTITLTNRDAKPRKISAFPYLEMQQPTRTRHGNADRRPAAGRQYQSSCVGWQMVPAGLR